jgi:hypothetical protein
MIPPMISFPRQQNGSDASTKGQQPKALIERSDEDDDDDASTESCQSACSADADEGDHILVMVVPLVTGKQTLRSSGRRISWKFNVDWEGGIDASFKSIETEESSLYHVLDIQEGDEDSSSRRDGYVSFKRGSLHKTLLSDDMHSSFRSSFGVPSNKVFSETTELQFEDSTEKDVQPPQANDDQAPSQSSCDNDVLDLKTSLGRLINTESDLADLLMANPSFQPEEIQLLQDRVRTLKELDDELASLAKAKAA